MLKILRERYHQKYRTMVYPEGPAPELPERFAGQPVLAGPCRGGCDACLKVCPTEAIARASNAPGEIVLDTGRCLFCLACQEACPDQVIRFSRDYRLAAATRAELRLNRGHRAAAAAITRRALAARFLARSLKLRQVSAGGCNACEADSNVLGTPLWDMGRFGIEFVASPRHADGLLITGPVTVTMRQALAKTWAAVPEPKIAIAVGACAISGGLYGDHPEQSNGAEAVVPVDLFIPGCPPHPLTLLDGLLRFLGIVKPAL